MIKPYFRERSTILFDDWYDDIVMLHVSYRILLIICGPVENLKGKKLLVTIL